MTVIAAIHDRGETWIGCDTLAIASDTRVPAVKIKWAVSNHWALGASGDSRLGDIIRAEMERLFANLNHPFLLTTRLRSIFEDHGIAFKSRREGEESPLFPATFILASPQQVWSIGACLAVTAINKGALWAIGSGSAEARGAGHALGHEEPRRRVRAAVDAAIALDPHCGGEPWMMHLTG